MAKTYFENFIHSKWNNKTRFLLMTRFIYNNVKNTGIFLQDLRKLFSHFANKISRYGIF